MVEMSASKIEDYTTKNFAFDVDMEMDFKESKTDMGKLATSSS